MQINTQIYVKNAIRGLKEHIRDTELNAHGIDVRQNQSMMSYNKSNNFYKGEWKHCMEKGAFDIPIEEKGDCIGRNITCGGCFPSGGRTQ